MTMHAALLLLLASAPTANLPEPADTLRIKVGSNEVDGRIYRPHLARVRIRIGSATAPVTAEWTNELTLGDSAGRQVMHWVTRGRRTAPRGATVTWELRQTYDARSLAPLGYHFQNSAGVWSRLRIDGLKVEGEKRIAADSAPQPVSITLDQPGFFAGASDLLPAAVSLEPGTIMTFPAWTPSSSQAEMRVFSVLE